MGGAGSSSANQLGMDRGSAEGSTTTPSSSSSSSTAYQSGHSAFTPTNPSYFHPGLSPFGMPAPPQSNFPMMSQGLAMPGSYPFLPSFHSGFMGSPFGQGLSGSGGSSFGSSGAGGYGFGGQSSDGLGSFRALLDESPERNAAQQQPGGSSSSSNGMGNSGGASSLSSDGRMSGVGNAASGMGSSMNGAGNPMAGGGAGGLGIGSGGMNGLPMHSSAPSMYGNSAMSLGYPGLFPMLSPMPNPMFMPMVPSPMMGQHYPMQPSHSDPSGPLSAMGHMAAMGSHLSGPGSGLPPPAGGGGS